MCLKDFLGWESDSRRSEETVFRADFRGAISLEVPVVFLLPKFSIGISEEKLKVKRPHSERVIAGIFVM